MRILQYHPRVEVYVAVDGPNGSVKYYDLTEDLTSCNVRRNSDAPSTFTATFQNQDGKYDNLISPMDRVVIRAGKDGESQPIFAGYVNTVDRWRLFDRDFTMSGTDVLYRLKKLYVDGGLIYNSGLFAGSRNGSEVWGGYAADIYRWLVDVSGWPSGNIDIGALPQRIVDWAKGIYEKQMTDVSAWEDVSKQFYETLMTTGSVRAGEADGIVGIDGPTTFNGRSPQYGAPKVNSAKGGLSAEKRQIILNAGYSILGTKYVLGGTDPHGGIDCSGFTRWCYSQAGITLPRTAQQQGTNPALVRVSREQLQPGDLIVWVGRFSNNGGNHVALYAGNDQMIHSSTTSTYYGVQVSSLVGWPTIDYMGYVAG